LHIYEINVDFASQVIAASVVKVIVNIVGHHFCFLHG